MHFSCLLVGCKGGVHLEYPSEIANPESLYPAEAQDVSNWSWKSYSPIPHQVALCIVGIPPPPTH